MQKSILGFFSKAPKTPLQPKSSNNTPEKTGQANNEPAKKMGAGGVSDKYPPGTLLWSKLPGYPWWPSMVCNHPTDKKTTRKGEIHVQFLDTPVTRSWVDLGMIKRWGEKVVKEGEGNKNWEKGVRDAEKVSGLSDQERLETLLVDLLPSDEEWSEEEEVSPGSKENKPGHNGEEPDRKRRRIIVMDSDDSDNDESFKPDKNDLDDHEEEDQSSGDSEGEPTTGEDEPDSSPVKGNNKRKMTAKNTASIKKGKRSSEISESKPSTILSTPVGKFASSLAASSKSPFSSPVPGLCDSTKKKLAMFGASGDSPSVQYSHNNLPFLKPENIKDRDKISRDHPDFNPRTVHVPADFLRNQTPAQRQWWELKSQYYDVVLFFKMGKFYELFHMDADIGVTELNLVYMKGNLKVSLSCFI